MLSDVMAFLEGSVGTISTLLVCYIAWFIVGKKGAQSVGDKGSAAAKELSKMAVAKKAPKPVKVSKIPYRENWTLEELADYDGKTPGKPMLLSIVRPPALSSLSPAHLCCDTW